MTRSTNLSIIIKISIIAKTLMKRIRSMSSPSITFSAISYRIL